jgi:hypothetical protein
MDENSLFMRTLERTLETQERMSIDIADIKATIKEAAQVMGFLSRELSEVKSRVERDFVELRTRCERLEAHSSTCPALLKYNAWAFSLRDAAWILAVVGAAVAVWYARK